VLLAAATLWYFTGAPMLLLISLGANLPHVHQGLATGTGPPRPAAIPRTARGPLADPGDFFRPGRSPNTAGNALALWPARPPGLPLEAKQQPRVFHSTSTKP